jgi:hypothetical protein
MTHRQWARRLAILVAGFVVGAGAVAVANQTVSVTFTSPTDQVVHHAAVRNNAASDAAYVRDVTVAAARIDNAQYPTVVVSQPANGSSYPRGTVIAVSTSITADPGLALNAQWPVQGSGGQAVVFDGTRTNGKWCKTGFGFLFTTSASCGGSPTYFTVTPTTVGAHTVKAIVNSTTSTITFTAT